jgi:UDP-N-acetylglucosamine/UDP-N-acetylgalactosamine diphosphorylase
MEGKILMEDKYKVAVAPDSNGGIYHALYNKEVINSLKERGILYSHCYDVDNCFSKVADPIFIGYSVIKNVDCSVKVFAKTLREEHVGVAECSQMPKEAFGMRKSDGSFNAGVANIINYIFSTEYLDHVLTFAEILEYHVTRKRIKHIDLESGELIVPKADTGIVLECSIFDVFPFPRKLSVLEVDCKEEFSSLKNILARPTQGSETPRQDLLAQRLRAFHASSGSDVTKDSNEALEVKVTSLVSIWW